MLNALVGDCATDPFASAVEPFPNTDMKEGKVVCSGELVDVGILEGWSSKSRKGLFMNVYCFLEETVATL